MSAIRSSFTFYVASDLHYGISRKGDSATEQLAEYVCAHPVDALLLGGDLGKDKHTLKKCLALFEKFPGFKLAVPGNHDIWLDSTWPTKDSLELYEAILPVVFQEHNFHPLHMKPFLTENLAFVGSMGWYDYSFRDDIDIAYECYESKTPPWAPMAIWNDANYAKWPLNDIELTDLMCQRLQEQFLQVKSATNVVGLVHHVVSKSLLVHPRERVPLRWRFANAFLGSNKLGDVFRSHKQTTQIFCGHIHMERSSNLGSIPCTTVGGGYKEKQLILSNTEHILNKWMFRSSPKNTQ